MIPWRALLVFLSIAVGTTIVIGVVAALLGWTVQSPGWALLAPIAMWAPALGSYVARHTVDRGFDSPIRLRSWGRTGAQVVLVPLFVPLAVYGTAYTVASFTGLAHWSPGGGLWTTPAQILLNVVINLSILGVVGTLTAMGEEIGWRGYLQPRLDAAGVRWSVVIVSLCQVAYHAPLIFGAGYLGGVSGLILFVVGDLPVTFIFAHESYRARGLWPAVFFHSFHNTISQWLFPHFFTGGDNELWLGEGGILPLVCYWIAGVGFYAWMRLRGESWAQLSCADRPTARSGLQARV